MNDLAVIMLSTGGFTVVDSAIFPFANQIKWYRSWDGYAFGFSKRRKRTVSLARVLCLEPTAMQVDHKNGCTFDNTSRNLRPATYRQNQWNQGKRCGGTSKHKGVYWSRDHKAWRAQIRPNRKKIHLGTFPSEDEAALAYNIAATEHFGEFARLNSVNKKESRGMASVIR